MAEALERSLKFQSTLSVRRATCHPHLRPQFVGISIHALREESDKIFYGVHAVRSRFQSTLSVRRATLSSSTRAVRPLAFQSTLSERRATTVT